MNKLPLSMDICVGLQHHQHTHRPETTYGPAKIYADEGVAQLLFLESDEQCETSHKDRQGKYQGQRGVTLPRMA